MKKLCAAILGMTLMSGLSISSFAQESTMRGTFTIDRAKAVAGVNRKRARSARPRVLIQSSDLYAKSRRRVNGRKILGTTYGGDGRDNLRKRAKR